MPQDSSPRQGRELARAGCGTRAPRDACPASDDSSRREEWLKPASGQPPKTGCLYYYHLGSTALHAGASLQGPQRATVTLFEILVVVTPYSSQGGNRVLQKRTPPPALSELSGRGRTAVDERPSGSLAASFTFARHTDVDVALPSGQVQQCSWCLGFSFRMTRSPGPLREFTHTPGGRAFRAASWIGVFFSRNVPLYASALRSCCALERKCPGGKPWYRGVCENRPA